MLSFKVFAIVSKINSFLILSYQNNYYKARLSGSKDESLAI
jgi:hypothetical protein